MFFWVWNQNEPIVKKYLVLSYCQLQYADLVFPLGPIIFNF